MSTNYELFTPLSETHVIDDPRYSTESNSGFLLVIPLYGAVPLGSTDPSDIVPGKRFCFLGKTYNQCYIELNTVLSRLDATVRRQDYNTLLANPSARLFDIWDNKGDLTAIPPFLLVDAASYPTFEGWDKVQFKRWSTLCGVIDDARPSLPFNVYSRFIEPAADQISLFFTPSSQSPSVFTVDVLKKVFQAAFSDSNLPKYTYDVIDLQTAVQRGLVMTGAHYLQFYFTFMTPADYTKLWATLQNRPELMRPWPSDSMARTIQTKIGDPPRGGEMTVAKMSHFKATAAIGQRSSYPDQQAVMTASATDLAKVMWGPANVSSGSPADAEWLHRNAFHFGGMDDSVNLASSQTRENLVFGTGESNTHMIRAENTISSLLRADASVAQDSTRTGTLVTTNLFKGTIFRQDLNSPGFRRSEQIPSWADTEKYMWLSFGLKYQWIMPGSALGLDFNASEVFDPFSRYIPLRVEARLDDALMDYIHQSTLSATASSAQSASLSSARVQRAVSELNSQAIPLSASYQEPMILWNAAKRHLPYIDVDNSHINNPTIAEPPSDEEGPGADEVVHVIGARPLLSHVTEGERVKAVRVVELNLAAKRRLGKVYGPSSPARPRIPRSLVEPILADPGLTSQPPDGGFVVVGDIALFGFQSLSAKFEKWEGPAPSDIVVLPDNPVSVERATLTEDFHLSSVISALEGTAFDSITFRNISVYHQNYKFDTTKAIGWHFDADLVVDESCGALYDVLSQVLGVDEPDLAVHVFLGADGGWDRPPSLHSFTLEGIFAGLALKPFDGVVLSKIGVRLFGIRTLKYDPSPQSTLEYGFSVFGTMNLDVPGSTVPLSLEYEMQEFGGAIFLGASIDTWKNPLGASGLVLSGISFSTSFAVSSPWKSLTFGVSADLMYEDISTTFQGSYTPRGSFELNASIRHVTVKTIDTLFRRVSHGDLSLPDLDVTIGAASLSISSGNGLSISLDSVTIGDYTSLDAGLTITPHNVVIRGDLTTDAVQFGDIELKRAFLQVTFEAKGNGKTTDLILGGEVAFSTLLFDAAVHLYRSPDGSKKSLEWTVLAALTATDEAWQLSKVVPEIEGTPFDLALTQVVFVAASKDDPSLGNMITSGFSFHQGVQVCAVLGEIEALNSLMRGPVSGLTLSAGWSKAKGFDLDVYLPAPTRLNLGNGVTSTPFTLSIATKPTVCLILSAGLNIPVPYSPAPLLFTLSLGTNLLGADATGQLSGWWVNPFGISPNVKVGPNLALSISIIFAQFVSTGTPSGFMVQGGLMIGETAAQLALSVNEDPMKELLYAEVQSLNITDVVKLASDIIDVTIPAPPRDFLDFQEVKLYICPAGLSIGTTFYPQGFSFRADVILFGKRADIECAVDAANLRISLTGGVDNFTLGPLVVRGTTGPRAVIECELGPTDQHLLVDGVISLFGAESTVHIAVDILPAPKFQWFTQLKFTDLLLFRLQATLVGAVSFSDLSDADFLFDALFEQHILQYIHDHIMGQFEQARQTVRDGIDAAQAKVDEAEAAWKAGVDKALADLDDAKKSWDAKNESVTAESNKVIDAYNKEIGRLQDAITSAQKDYDAAMTNAQNAVSAAQRDRAQALQSAQHDLDNAKRDVSDAIDAAQRDVDYAKKDFDAAFGSANAAIESARRDVQSLQNQINDLYSTIHDYERAPWYEFWKKAAIAGLYVAVGALEASKAIADGVLQAAEAVLKSVDFVAKETAFKAAQAALDAARETGKTAIDVAKTAVDVADKTSQAALDAANETLEITKQGVEWGVLQGAKEALQAYKVANDAAFRAATQALVDLVKCAEYLAYQAAKIALDAARAATVTLDAARAALDLAQRVGEEALEIGQWVADHALEAFDIRVVHLSGSLRGMVGAGGSMAKPFTARIEGVVVGQPFTLDGEFDLRKTADFITFIFENLWDKIKAEVV
ncbi:hypothetical protein BD310DRAFT_931958 [Dichomitus squalens]|uniref:Uncharacterized protein n=1 Tax=Dichomitus squalens TaxID=114155 RepID=A0A4Q9PPJ6_9APHY|nr:hypothetical protein BD310DRAFT_931958 [Dichomitus squalens]